LNKAKQSTNVQQTTGRVEMAKKRGKAHHPIQPLITSPDGVTRFKGNAIVRFLLDAGPFNLNQLAIMQYSDEDREQFAQLIGYSLSGFGELSYVSDKTYNTAAAQPVYGKQS
jgi:hypothetical protein